MGASPILTIPHPHNSCLLHDTDVPIPLGDKSQSTEARLKHCAHAAGWMW